MSVELVNDFVMAAAPIDDEVERNELEATMNRTIDIETEEEREQVRKELEATLPPLSADEAAEVDTGRPGSKTPEAENEEDCNVYYAKAEFEEIPPQFASPSDIFRALDGATCAWTFATPRVRIESAKRVRIFDTPRHKMIRLYNHVMRYADFLNVVRMETNSTGVLCAFPSHTCTITDVTLDELVELLEEKKQEQEQEQEQEQAPPQKTKNVVVLQSAEEDAEEDDDERKGVAERGDDVCAILGIFVAILSIALSAGLLVTAANRRLIL